MPRFLHIADNHLCSKQYGDTRRGGDFLRSLLACIDIAHSRGLKHILNGGDMLDMRTLQAEVGPMLEVVDRRLVELGITMWVVTGNHDFCEPPWVRQIEERRAYWHPQNTVGGLRSLDHRAVEIEGVRIFGLPSMSKEELLTAMSVMPPSDVLLWHGAVREFAGFPKDSDPSATDFPITTLKAVLLGDQHIHSYETFGTCLMGYPGSTELAEKGEPFEKFAAVIEIGETGAQVVEKVPIPTRKALGWRISNEGDMERAILDLERLRGTPLLLFVDYLDQVEDVPRRLAACFNPDDVVFRPKSEPTPPMPMIALMGAEAALEVTPETMPDLTECPPATFIAPLFADDPELASLALRLAASKDDDPMALIDAYVSRQLDTPEDPVSPEASIPQPASAPQPAF